MTQIDAMVDGDVSRNRVLEIRDVETTDTIVIGTPTRKGGSVEFVTGVPLKDGQRITINIKHNPIWTIETSTKVRKGQYVTADIGGKVGVYDDAHMCIGYALDNADVGGIIRVVRSPKVNVNPEPNTEPEITPQDDGAVLRHDDNLEDLTVNELRDIAKKQNISGYTRLKKDELIDVLQGE